jgi:hypothetical protein
MVYQGKVTYKKDPNLVAWGCPEVQTYILDENGDRIPETKPFVDPDMIRWILSHRRPELSFACVYSGPGPNRVGVVEFLSRGSFRASRLRGIPSAPEAIVLWLPNWPAAGVSAATGRGQKRLGQCQPSATMPFHPHDDAARDDGRDKAALCTHR